MINNVSIMFRLSQRGNGMEKRKREWRASERKNEDTTAGWPGNGLFNRTKGALIASDVARSLARATFGECARRNHRQEGRKRDRRTKSGRRRKGWPL